MFWRIYTFKQHPSPNPQAVAEVFKRPPLVDQKMLGNFVHISCMLVLKKATYFTNLYRMPQDILVKLTNKLKSPGRCAKTLLGSGFDTICNPKSKPPRLTRTVLFDNPPQADSKFAS